MGYRRNNIILMLVSEIMMTILRSNKDLRTISSSFLQWVSLLLFELQSALWIDIWLGRILISLQRRQKIEGQMLRRFHIVNCWC